MPSTELAQRRFYRDAARNGTEAWAAGSGQVIGSGGCGYLCPRFFGWGWYPLRHRY